MSNDPTPTAAGGIHITHVGDRHPDVEEAEKSPWVGVTSQKETTMPQPEIKMMALKDHMGAGGGIVKGDPKGENGALYTLHNEREAQDHVAAGIGKRLSPEPPKQGEAPALAAVAADAPWDLEVTPAAYLEKWPEGDHAEQARRLVGEAKAGKAEAPAAKPTAKP